MLSADPLFLGKHIITFMGIIRVQFLLLLALSDLSGTDQQKQYVLPGVYVCAAV